MIQLREYQNAAIQAVWRYFLDGNKGNPIVAMPTGTGKSLTMAGFIKSACDAYPETRFLSLTHVKELIDGNHKALMRLWPTAPAGVYSAGLRKKQADFPITFAGIQSIRRKPEIFGKINLILIDECHLVSDSDKTSYQLVISKLRETNPKLKVIGFSATPWRMKKGLLTESGGLFTDTCLDLGTGDAFVWFIEQGYLIEPKPFRPDRQIDVSDVHLRNGEFAEDEMEAAIDRQNIIHAALDESLEKAANRRHWLVFMDSIRHVEEAVEYLNSKGISALPVHSKMSDAERDKNIQAFKNGKARVLCNKNILTTGFDAPFTDCVVLLRPTRSPGLHVQILGRGTRPVYAPGFNLETTEGRLNAIYSGPKQDCLVLDFAGNTERLGPINYPTIPNPRNKRKGASSEAPSKVCECCGRIVHATVRVCPQCGTEFEFEEKNNVHASDAEIVSRAKPVPEKIIAEFVVDRMTASLFSKPGRPICVRVDYFCGKRRYSTFISPEADSRGAHYLARKWWQAHTPHRSIPMPPTAAALIQMFGYVRKPKAIRVCLSTRPYPDIMEYISDAIPVGT